MVGECPEGARNDGADDGEGAEARGAFPCLLVVEVESGECCSRAAAGVRREGEKCAAGSRKVPDRGCASLSQSDLVPVAIVAGWRRDLLLLLTDTHNEGVFLWITAELMQRLQSSEFRRLSGGDAVGAWSVKRRHAL